MGEIVPQVQRFDDTDQALDKTLPPINLLDNYIDLEHFALLVYGKVADPAIQAAARGVMDAVAAYILAERHRGGSYPDRPGWDVYLDSSRGVAIFFPAAASSFYTSRNYAFATGATWAPPQASAAAAAPSWGAMLVRYFQLTQPGGRAQATPPPPRAHLRRVSTHLAVAPHQLQTGYAPQLTAAPATVLASQVVTVSGTGFAPNEALAAWLLYPDGRRQDFPQGAVADATGGLGLTLRTFSQLGRYEFHLQGALSQRDTSVAFTVAAGAAAAGGAGGAPALGAAPPPAA